jgi:hypothetical protein
VEGLGGKHYRSKKMNAQRSTHVYEVRPRKDHRGFDLISDVLPFGRLWYGEPDATSNAIGYVSFTAVHMML